MPRGRQGARRGAPPNTGTGSPFPPGGLSSTPSTRWWWQEGAQSRPGRERRCPGTAAPGDSGGGRKRRMRKEGEEGGRPQREPRRAVGEERGILTR